MLKKKKKRRSRTQKITEGKQSYSIIRGKCFKANYLPVQEMRALRVDAVLAATLNQI